VVGLLILATTTSLAGAVAREQAQSPTAPIPAQLLEEITERLEQGKLDEAEALLPDVPEGAAGAEAAFRLGRALVLARQYERAEPLLRRALGAGHGDAGVRLFLSAALWENGRPAEAEDVLRDGLAAGGSRARHQLARLLVWQGRYEEALEQLGSLAAAFPSRLDLQLDTARALEGAALREGGGWEPALEAFTRCRRLAPEHYEIRYGLARALQRLGRTDEARIEMEAYRQLLAEDTARSRERGRELAQVELALALWSAGAADEALADLKALPASVESLTAIARVEESRGQPEQAVAALQRAVGLAPDRADLRLRLEELMASTGGSR
jgi:tetratricopeptide (TPR) repeat protein